VYNIFLTYMKFEVLRALMFHIVVLWVVEPCSLVVRYNWFVET